MDTLKAYLHSDMCVQMFWVWQCKRQSQSGSAMPHGTPVRQQTGGFGIADPTLQVSQPWQPIGRTAQDQKCLLQQISPRKLQLTFAAPEKLQRKQSGEACGCHTQYPAVRRCIPRVTLLKHCAWADTVCCDMDVAAVSQPWPCCRRGAAFLANGCDSVYFFCRYQAVCFS